MIRNIGSNDKPFDVTYIDDLVDAHLLAADRLLSNPEGVAGEVFFITSDSPVPFWDLARAVWRELGHVSDRKPVVIPKAVAMMIAYLAEWYSWITGTEAIFTRFRVIFICTGRRHSIKKAREVLGYEPKVQVNEGVRRMVQVCESIYNFTDD